MGLFGNDFKPAANRVLGFETTQRRPAACLRTGMAASGQCGAAKRRVSASAWRRVSVRVAPRSA